MTTEYLKMYDAAIAADHAWTKALEDKFGKKAGWHRYYPESRAGELAPLHDAFLKASEELHSFVLSGRKGE